MKPVARRYRTASGEHDIIMQSRTGKVSVEVKNLKNPVSAAVVEKHGKLVSKDRNVVKRGIVVSTKSGFTPEAVEVAKKRHIKLIDLKTKKKRKKTGFSFF